MFYACRPNMFVTTRLLTIEQSPSPHPNEPKRTKKDRLSAVVGLEALELTNLSCQVPQRQGSNNVCEMMSVTVKQSAK